MRKNWTTQEQRYLEELYTTGYTAGEICRLLQRSLDSVNTALTRFHVRSNLPRTFIIEMKPIEHSNNCAAPHRSLYLKPLEEKCALVSYEMMLNAYHSPPLSKCTIHITRQKLTPCSNVNHAALPNALRKIIQWLTFEEKLSVIPLSSLEKSPAIFTVQLKKRPPQFQRMSTSDLVFFANTRRQKLGLPLFAFHDMIE